MFITEKKLFNRSHFVQRKLAPSDTLMQSFYLSQGKYLHLKWYFHTQGLHTHIEPEIWDMLYAKINVFHLSSANALHLYSL